MAEIGHFVRHDQVVLDVDGGLHVVANNAGAFAAGCLSIGGEVSPRIGVQQ
jgi:hypothetical protein